ncbi:hypothetical protein PC9H_000161 [Pleurotus ostreatus]|uniref:MARVEL domain-containing protein n=1 Tax=Pleurotus ostreatus TaxID=5322 RepID=A0A8H7A0K6_PLEOS|nr:uncharacterized protein PC9H_000161 [Pleurotus ostreatus]KAF7439825.1 hypothetical protein PC9H_000161 [Pleurotus ostreatus]KAJ8701001.1 hypothetical protein PTI98_003970 [Pleurotus ostreatus]
MSLLEARTAFYFLLVLVGLAETVLGAFVVIGASNDFFSTPFYATGAALAAITSIWTVVLVIFGLNPQWKHALSKPGAHVTSTLVFTIVWVVYGIASAISMSSKCRHIQGNYCALAGAFTGLAFLLFTLTSAAMCLFCCTPRTRRGQEDGDSDIPSHELTLRAPKSRTVNV